MHSIKFIAFCILLSIQLTPFIVIGDSDVNVIRKPRNDPTFNSDVNLFNHHSVTDDVEMLPNSYFNGNGPTNGGTNVSIGNRSGNLYQHDDFYSGQLDAFPDQNNNYDYGKCYTFWDMFIINFIRKFLGKKKQ